MKRATILLVICLGVAFLVVSTQAQRPGGGGPGTMPTGRPMMMQVLPLESSWAYICFELGVADEILPKVRKIYQASWNERKEKIISKMEAARGDTEAMRAIRADADKIKSDLDKKLKDVLTAEQLEKLAKWEKESRQRPGGPPPGTPNR